MESRLIQKIDRALIEATQALSPEERLLAFLTHCRLVMEVYEAANMVEFPSVRLQS